MAVSFKGAHFPQEIILMGVRWYVAYPLSYRHVEELMQERGVPVDHATIQRWVVKYSPALEAAFHRRKRPVWVSWRMDKTYIRIKGQWYYLYRAVDKTGQTIDFLLTKHRDERAAKRFLIKAIRRHGVPETITIDGSEANAAAIRSYNKEHGTAIVIRQVKYLNNVVEQDHRAVKRVTRPMLGFKSFAAGQATLVGIELMHMIKKRQMVSEAGDEGLTAAEQFYALASSSPHHRWLLTPTSSTRQKLRQNPSARRGRDAGRESAARHACPARAVPARDPARTTAGPRRSHEPSPRAPHPLVRCVPPDP
jgi:transposase-like protein